TRLSAALEKKTRPEGSSTNESSLQSSPVAFVPSVEAQVKFPPTRSYQKTSQPPFESLGRRFVAPLVKQPNPLSRLITASLLSALGSAPLNMEVERFVVVGAGHAERSLR